MNPHNKEKKKKSPHSTPSQRGGWRRTSMPEPTQGLVTYSLGRVLLLEDLKTKLITNFCLWELHACIYILLGDFIGRWQQSQQMITDMVNFGFSFRADKERALSSSGPPGTGGVREITVTATGTRTASTPSPSAVPRSKACPPGTQRSAPPRWPPRTAVGTTPTSES